MNVLIVTGLSGAGKSIALRVLEDMGYVCVDNLPGMLVGTLLDLCGNTEPPIQNVAVVIDSRSSVFRYSTERMLQSIESINYPYEILFLDCSNEILQRRYSETRRRHPMHDDIFAGILMERELLEPLRQRAKYIIDTSGMTPMVFSRMLEDTIKKGENARFRLVIESFGFKRGIPIDSDIVIDMRYTANPFYEEALRNLSGRDKQVFDFVMSDPLVRRHLNELTKTLKSLIPGYEREGKHRLKISFGCTGGRHRSVAMAEALYDNIKEFRNTIVRHRDLVIEAESISERFES